MIFDKACVLKGQYQAGSLLDLYEKLYQEPLITGTVSKALKQEDLSGENNKENFIVGE